MLPVTTRTLTKHFGSHVVDRPRDHCLAIHKSNYSNIARTYTNAILITKKFTPRPYVINRVLKAILQLDTLS
jgi:hypothetical protein